MSTLTSRQVSSHSHHRRTRAYSERYRDNVYYQDGYIVTAVLAALLYLLVAVSLDAAGYTENLTILVPVTGGAVLLSLLMSFSRFDGFFAMSHSLFTGLAWILFLMTTLVTPAEIQAFQANEIYGLQAKSYHVLLSWVIWVSAAMEGEATADNYVFIFELSFLIWWLSFLGIWSIFRYGYTWRAIVPAGIVLAINVFNAPESVLGFLVIFSVVALVLLIRTNLAEQQLRWREQRIYFSPDITFDFLRSALYYSVIVLALAWILPGMGRNQEVQSVTAPIEEGVRNISARFNDLHPSLTQREVPGYAAFGSSLALGGARQVDDRPVLQIQAPQGRYWRAVTYDYYDGHAWQNTRRAEQNFAALEAIPAPAWSDREPVTQTVTLLSSTGGVLFAAQDIIMTDVPLSTFYETVNEETGTVDLSYTTVRGTLEADERYTVVSNYADVSQRDLRDANGPVPPTVQAVYTQLPIDFSSRIGELAAEVAAGQPTTYDKAKAIETYLRTNYTYNEQISAPPEGEDPIEYFLFDLREGYCDYYATAMVLMLRSLGIPARAASGYAQGEHDMESQIYYVSGDDAHTWVEVYFPELGWIEFEPTAGEGTLSRPLGLEFPEAAADDPSAPDASQPEAGSSAADAGFDEGLENLPQDGPLAAGESGSVNPWRRYIGLLLAPIMLFAGLWALRRLRVAGPDEFSPDVSPIIYDRMIRWAERLGLRVGPSQTPYEHANHLSRSLPAGEPYIRNITDEYVVYRFGGGASGLTQADSEGEASGTVGNSWRELRPILQKAWMQRQVGDRGKKRNPFDLQ